MKALIKNVTILLFVCLFLSKLSFAQTAIIKVNKHITYQKITGFGGFVCSGTFAYNHMTTTEIKKMWGKTSEAGYNIMRLFLPEETSWSTTIETAKLAKSLGLIVFASPWTMPAEWKTNNNIAAKYVDENNVEQLGYLKEEYYSEYAAYLNRYVTYLRNNGVELDYISIQNEPDMPSTYHGCLWTPTQITNFIKNYANLIDCKIIAPEGVGITDNYANALNDSSVLANFEVFAGHQYSYIQEAHKNIQAKGKDVWMTEYLINWNADENTSRNFNWTKDAFSFASKVNAALLKNVNAWVHYATKRFYGLMGDGTNGTTNSAITKRGYILSHYAKYTIGSTRIDNTITDDTKLLETSSYLSVTGDSVIVMIINPSTNAYTVTVDLPFFTKFGDCIKTTASLNMSASSVGISGETCRPKVTIDASSFTTLIFAKSNERSPSQMTSEPVHYNKIEEQTSTNAAFGTNYQLTGKTVTFDHSNSLISANTTQVNGYLKLNDRYNYLIFQIKNISSAGSYTSANTTLYYINNNGTLNYHNYGTITFTQGTNSEWILDISRSVLTDGCTGIIGLTNGNWTSILTLDLGDVYFRIGSEKMYKFAGIYNGGDSYLLNCLEDNTYTSLDFTQTTGITTDQNWQADALNKNCIYYVNNEIKNPNSNVIIGDTCDALKLSSGGGNFYVPEKFYANTASFTQTFSGYSILVLPFESNIPEGVKVYTMQETNTEVVCSLYSELKIPANTPMLIEAYGTYTFEGSGEVSIPQALTVNNLNGMYIERKVPVGSYYLKTINGETAFYRANSGVEPVLSSFTAYLTSTSTASSLPLNFGNSNGIEQLGNVNIFNSDNTIYDLLGRKVVHLQKNVIYIKNGKKVVYLTEP